ncbi:MAG: electron transfer flavoprotein subunit beta/FixA family protein [Deltaproteobacteria bacterium]|nr:electron transfer flavoprotein subunit beta/FixA family protein [Deltaproteobacteria bacterium]MBW1952150.1 electron transfer flavoprotein subunit beta/FixA family protein [Deltaproteobacteria bacterium]MBW1986161.1 electron transfer flavoprotein subunit beta/FixA family protein [Deltaproteobacteria bacterium]MBW2134915.1 electron transfer flavoprotein subunit beta/FixA family protein [Deltaproteobacteria bacterium]
MKIIVCIKQVPETQEIRLDPVTHTLQREGVKSIINPFDLYALEEGLRVRERQGGSVTVLSMGPPQAADALREALTYGADGAVLLSDRAFAGADTWATAYTLARGITKLGGADLIICGKQAIDGDTAQVGPELAAFLDIPYVAWARQLTFVEPEVLQVERLLDHGYDGVEVRLPALITVVKEINEPRVPSFKAKLRAKKQKIPVLGLQDLGLHPHQVGLPGSFTQVVKVFPPPARGQRELWEGSPTELANRLWTRLYEMKLG